MKNKSYGLVWDEERHPEDIVIKVGNRTPYIEEDKDLSTEGKGTSHILIEGDNFASLTAMQDTHKNSVDIICIDPPYNTGNEFIYNDDRVDPDDGYKHSMWLNFMDKRMRLAYNLLKDDGICYVFIGHDELGNLTLLLDQMFGRQNRVTIISRATNFGKNMGAHFAESCDYILCYAKNKEAVKNSFYRPVDESDYDKTDERGRYKLNRFRSSNGTKNQYKILCPDGKYVVPKSYRQWRINEEGYLKLLNDDRIEVVPGSNQHLMMEDGSESVWKIRKKVYKDEERLPPYNFIAEQSCTNEDATRELKSIFGGEFKFDYPKPTALIKHLIKITNKSNDITVLDFFAGSGTTGHAVIDLNAEDQGTRSSIMCAMNEFDNDADICTDVTYKRLSLVVEKWRKLYNNQLDLLGDGFPPRLRYFITKLAENNDPITNMITEETNKEAIK